MMGNPSKDEPIQIKSETPFQKKESKTQIHSSSSPKTPSLLGNESKENILNIDRGNRSVARASYFSGNVQELDEKCLSMMEKTFKQDKDGKLLYSCTICGKQAINSALKNHIEANHLEGISIPCNFCETICSTRNALKLHVTRNHLEGISIPCNFCKMIFRTKNALRFHMTKNHKESSLHWSCWGSLYSNWDKRWIRWIKPEISKKSLFLSNFWVHCVGLQNDKPVIKLISFMSLMNLNWYQYKCLWTFPSDLHTPQ